jgi:hypothetical protein
MTGGESLPGLGRGRPRPGRRRARVRARRAGARRVDRRRAARRAALVRRRADVRDLPRGPGSGVPGLGSRPRHAGGRPDDRPRALRRRPAHAPRRDDDVPPAGRAVRRSHGGAGRHARRLRRRLHARGRASPAILDSVPRGAAPGPGDRLGHAAARAGGAALVRALSARGSGPTIRSTGPAASRRGITSAPSATSRACARTTIRPRTDTRPPGRRSGSPARLATARARPT